MDIPNPDYQMPKFLGGHVWLGGAGPGDPGLLTLLGAYALQHADIVVYDALVSAEILQMAGPRAVLKYAGKRGGKPSTKQRDITLSLIEFAREGKRVLRLKGGDPFIFGRGGEETFLLAEAGIPFRVIPGVTSGIAAPAYAGIPLTHRDFNSVVTFLTGHGIGGDFPSSIDWSIIAQGSPVIVMFMAMKHMPDIVPKLLEAGRSPDEPVAVISQATTPDQRVLDTSLGSCVHDIQKSKIAPPAIIVVGEVVSLRPHLDWLSALQGKPLLPLPNTERDAG
ncbi:MAG: uroporphyrinogen-III C-methyltransferase [bacterium]